MGVSGKADVIEFYHDQDGELVEIIPVEYKRGIEKEDNCDAMQLCAQAICLEEMTGLSIEHGFLFTARNEGEQRSRSHRNYGKKQKQRFLIFIHYITSFLNLPKQYLIKTVKHAAFLNIANPRL